MQSSRKPRKSRRVLAGLDDDIIGFPQQQQSTMRLDRSCEVDLLAFAIR